MFHDQEADTNSNSEVDVWFDCKILGQVGEKLDQYFSARLKQVYYLSREINKELVCRNIKQSPISWTSSLLCSEVACFQDFEQ